MSRLELAGWLVFLGSGIGFLVSGVLAGDAWVVGGSLLFELGVLLLILDRSG